MKTVLISLLTATLLGCVVAATGRSFDTTSLVSIAFAATLVGWTFGQYAREPRALTWERPIRLELPPATAGDTERPERLAA